MKINEKNYCQVCNEEKFIEVKKNNFFLRTDSSNKELIDFKNLICYNCGTIYHQPKIDEEKLIHHYENQYRNTDSALYLDKKIIDLPIKFEWTSISFKRFHAFYKILRESLDHDKFSKIKNVLDFGCYQGAFLYACKKFLNLRTIGTDYDSEGLKMAKSLFMVDDVFKTEKNFYEKKIEADIIVLLHVFEHLADPVEFLTKIKKNVLKKDALIYLEIPNPYSNPLNDPTHLNLFSEETIKYIMKCCNYEIIFNQKRAVYRNSSLLRNNDTLNIHILAKSLNKDTVSFPKINIGSKTYSNLIKQRNISNLKFIINYFKSFIKLSIRTAYTFVMYLLNLISSNLAISLHEKLKKFFIRK